MSNVLNVHLHQAKLRTEMEVPDHKIDTAMKIATRYVSMDAPLVADEDTNFLDLFVPTDAPETDEYSDA